MCTKNNFDDIKEVLENHPDMQLNNEHISVIKSNWTKDKPTNIIEISKILNIGLDSLVFIDDSNFEINMVKESLPEVTVLKVPDELYKYPKMLTDNINLFYENTLTNEDKNRSRMYKEQAQRELNKLEFKNVKDYLSSLNLEITIHEDNKNHLSRISQMTQKQINLT